ncbi:DUF192 domain-containing protein [Roseofilum casamattae]|uniref:DUF192 domain-containing protein n=1 Tax=Roseofilum casamattae BLCC-M143 TaxID=3022442 RepID=A0ABT7C4V0_9CYAN|nr:DUF192 domain-containing protein [Roseofilum casamattae]MDJ1185813.1 DUF192 domain-containing protein [Roseofilum casamattae BLCC-M143]
MAFGFSLLWSLGVGASLAGCESAQPNPTISRDAIENTQLAQELGISAEVKIKGQTLFLEVARTREEQALGLMYRPPLPDNRGMLFPFESPRLLSFWMKNVPVPLDMVFLLGEEVIAIAESVPPCTTPSCPSYGPEKLADRVLELRAGRARELGLQVGDRLAINFYNN